MTFPSKPKPVFGLELSHRSQSGQPQGEGKDELGSGTIMESQPHPAVEPKYVLTSHPASGPAQPGEGQTADLQDAPGKILATCRFREILKAGGEKPVTSIFNRLVLGGGSQF